MLIKLGFIVLSLPRRGSLMDAAASPIDPKCNHWIIPQNEHRKENGSMSVLASPFSEVVLHTVEGNGGDAGGGVDILPLLVLPQ